MRALHLLCARVRLLVLSIVLGLSTVATARAEVIPFSNGWSGLLEAGAIAGDFFFSNGLTLDSATSDLDPLPGSGTWTGPGGTIDLDFNSRTLVPNVPFEQYTGTFTITGGTGAFAGSSGGGNYSSIYVTIAGGDTQVTMFSQGEISLIPEPAVWLLLAGGLGLLGFLRIRRAAIIESFSWTVTAESRGRPLSPCGRGRG
jgi:hypothetical protein